MNSTQHVEWKYIGVKHPNKQLIDYNVMRVYKYSVDI